MDLCQGKVQILTKHLTRTEKNSCSQQVANREDKYAEVINFLQGFDRLLPSAKVKTCEEKISVIKHETMKGSLSLYPDRETERAGLLARKALSTNPDSSILLAGIVVLRHMCSI